MVQTVGEALDRIRRDSRDEYEKGIWFENLTMRVLKDNPEYEIEKVQRWKDWEEREALTGLDGRDKGIDLVARHKDGSWIAIQCKCHAEDHRLSKSDLNDFLVATQNPLYSMRWIVLTCDLTGPAEAVIRDGSPPISRIDFLRHLDDPISEEETRPPVRTPWPRQLETIDKVVHGLKHHDRGRMTMACGTGKTFTSLRIAEQVVPDGGRVLFLAPSIALVSQARREWLRHTVRPLECRVVCSDYSAGGRGETNEIHLYGLECPVTSDPEELARLLSQESDNTRVVFCTYQSLMHLTRAQRDHQAPAFDLIICDEAHRTTGVDRAGSPHLLDEYNGFQSVHREEFLRSQKRLYMTATPRIYTASSVLAMKTKGFETVDMSDLDVYGPELDFLSFKDAVNERLLSDYRVIVLGVHDENITPGLREAWLGIGEYLSEERQNPFVVTGEDMMRLLGTSLAINGFAQSEGLEQPGRLHRTIAFANSIIRSRFFAEGLKQPQLRSLITRRARQAEEGADRSLRIEAQHLDGRNNAYQRLQALRRLGKAGDEDETAQVLCNVRLFGEGVDVPTLDAIVFMEPRDSQVDIVQAVGRVMRLAEGKKLGYIIVPIPIAPGEDLPQALSEGTDGFRALGQVLRALQSHDGRLAEEPFKFVTIATPNGEEHGGIEGIQLDLDLSQDLGIYAHVVAASGLGRPGLLVADQITYAVRRAAAIFEEGELAEDLATAMGLTVDRNHRDICTIAALLVGNACLLHRRLSDMPQMEWLDDLARVSGDPFPAEPLQRDWEKILEQDYKPVFEPALAVLGVLPLRRFAGSALCILAECANRTATSLSELGYDHAGPLYHRILPNAEATGSFYTNNLSALLLARLAIGQDFVDWGDEEAIRRLRIMDPACGTGTLLMGVMHVLKSRLGEHRRLSYDETSDFHKLIVENVLHGLDINRHAVQLAACNLTLGAPTVDYRRINLFTLKHGPQPDGTIRAGSLEILGSTDSHDPLGSLVRPLATQQGLGAAQVDDTDLELPTGDLDLVIMNPPFTNNVKRGRQYTTEQVKQMQQHELGLRDHLTRIDPQAGQVIDANSISTFFTPLADQLLSKKGGGGEKRTDPTLVSIRTSAGTLAKILPATGCVSASGLEERRFFADRFHIERIITSHDPKRINFSENTAIHECLLIARRAPDPPPTTEFFALRRMPSTPQEALEVADAIAGGGGTEWGSRTLWPTERMAEGVWTPVQWFDARLAEAAYSLSNSSLLEPAGLRHNIGPASQRIQEAFAKRDDAESDAVQVFWSISSKLRKTLQDKPDQWAVPKPEHASKAERYWQQRSHVLVAHRHDTVSGRLTALWSPSPTVGSGWIPVSIPDQPTGKALVAWWNSTPARLLLLNMRSKKLTYPTWSLAQLRQVGIPKPNNPAWGALAQAWEEACELEMVPLSQGEECPARHLIDQAAALALGMEEEQLAEWRQMLAQEPTISNRPAPLQEQLRVR
ncbi:MAG: DEAD/DEAH box helicase family protein [bacterium]|nr:DEAD/DEAH box helicase family protein [bacterium]